MNCAGVAFLRGFAHRRLRRAATVMAGEPRNATHTSTVIRRRR